MKRKLFFLRIMSILLVLPAACTNDDYDVSILSVNETLIDFGKDAEEKSITVTTSREIWQAFSDSEWLTVSQNGNTLTLSAAENTGVRPRMASVMVMAGKLSQKVDVVQTATGESIDITSGKIFFDCRENVQNIDVTAFSPDNWSVSTDFDWITVKAKPYKNQLVITVTENRNKTAREGKITLVLNQIVKELEVIQQGVRHFLLPVLSHGASIDQMEAFEKARGGYRIHYPFVEIGDYFNWGFNTPSDVFPTIYYTMIAGKLSRAETRTPLFDKQSLTDFGEYLTREGFTSGGQIGENRYYTRKDGQSFVRVHLFPYIDEEENKWTIVRYYTHPLQTAVYPTFADGLPYGMNDFTADAGKVKQWETETGGGIFNAGASDAIRLYFSVPQNPWFARIYFMKGAGNTVKETDFVFNEPTLVFRKESRFFPYSGENLDLFYPTDEFEALMNKEGFSYFQQSSMNMLSDVFFYYNHAKKRMTGVYLDRNERVNFHLFVHDETTSANTLPLLKWNETLQGQNTESCFSNSGLSTN